MKISGSVSDLTIKTKTCIKPLEYAWLSGGKTHSQLFADSFVFYKLFEVKKFSFSLYY